MDFQTILIALIGGGMVGFLQFLIQRHDSKSDKNKEVLQAIERLDWKLQALEKTIASVDEKGDERYAISTRIRILRFEDELQEGRLHSKDSWDCVIADCDSYDNYCEKNKDFRNGMTEATVRHIRHGYDERLEKGDWR